MGHVVGTTPRTGRSVRVEPLDATFWAVVRDVVLARASDATIAELTELWLEYALLVFPGQHMTPHEQDEFARCFGDLEFTATPLTNIQRDGTLRSTGHDLSKSLRGNERWHHDSTYMPVQAAGAVFTAEIVPDEGGDTEFADMRAAYDALPAATKAQLEGLRVHHSIAHSRQVLGFEFSADEQEALKGAVHPLVRTIPRSRRRSLYLAAHASRIVDWPVPEGRLLLLDLIEHATRPAFVYRHAWRVGDLVIWDNRATMHRATPFDDATQRRELRRVTTLDVEQPALVTTAVAVVASLSAGSTAAVWPDTVRSGPAEKRAYDRPEWHYINVPHFLTDAGRTSWEW
jgi:alpha-ketoglutarate-dependent 2,4-dichlorophenoxyacetate dioxygenase